MPSSRCVIGRQVLLPGAPGAGAAEDGDWVYQRSAADVRAEVLAAQRRREQDSVWLGAAHRLMRQRMEFGRLAMATAARAVFQRVDVMGCALHAQQDRSSQPLTLPE